MKESVIERHLALSVKKMGGMAVKFVSPGLGWGAGQNRITAGKEDGICGIKGTGQKAPVIAGETETAAYGSGVSGLCDR